VIGYVRVSTQDQADNGVSLDAQRSALRAEADRRGWTIEFVSDEGVSGAVRPERRPGLSRALQRLDRGEVSALMVVRLDRISRSVSDFAGLVDRADARGWGLVLLSPAIDLTEASGRFVAHVLASAAAYERDLASARTKEGLRQRKAEGVRLGRPRRLPERVRLAIVGERDRGKGWTEIANQLNESGVPTAHGGQRWYASTVRAAYESAHSRRDEDGPPGPIPLF
jgi:DNA invertase Pin-like site-specific DNA recombinase